MIAYLDTSVLVPILIEESSSRACQRLWNDADDVVAARIGYVEISAALAAARRLGRLTTRQQRLALRSLDDVWSQMQIIEIDQPLVTRAAHLADALSLRGYDAVHAAAAESVANRVLVAGSGDRQLLDAWRHLGLNTYDTNAG
ncbi:MAG: type II toxin-antitoxin system VapC family toxin [Actinomycetota bacterium]|nr:type II toxin-antitoxin system VapC family toxin [Actinomycetota bacterium]